MEHKLKEQQKPSGDRLDTVPTRYRIYDKLFSEDLETGIPEHSQYDHEICLIDEKNPTFQKLYPLNETQLEVLKKYLDEMTKKGFIRKSTSSAGYPVIFVPKKNSKLRLVVDYRKLNAITKKDRTPLPLMDELQDRLTGKQ